MNSLQTITELTYSSIKMFMMRKLIEISLARIIDSEQTVQLKMVLKLQIILVLTKRFKRLDIDLFSIQTYSPTINLIGQMLVFLNFRYNIKIQTIKLELKKNVRKLQIHLNDLDFYINEYKQKDSIKANAFKTIQITVISYYLIICAIIGVCWADAPEGWVGCRMGAAKDIATCAQIIFDQVTSVGELALSIATFRSSSSLLTKAGTTTKNLIKNTAIAKKFASLKAAVKNNQKLAKVIDYAKKAKKVGEKGNEAFDQAIESADAVDALGTIADDNVTDADLVRITALVAALADPTEVAGVFSSYSYPLCSKIFD